MITLSTLSTYPSSTSSESFIFGSSSISLGDGSFSSGSFISSSSSTLGDGSLTRILSSGIAPSVLGAKRHATYAASPIYATTVSHSTVSHHSTVCFDFSKLEPIDLRPYLVRVVFEGIVLGIDSSLLGFTLSSGPGYRIEPWSSSHVCDVCLGTPNCVVVCDRV